MFSSRSFIALALKFRSLIHFELNLAYNVKQDIGLIRTLNYSKHLLKLIRDNMYK